MKAEHVFIQPMSITKDDRRKLNGHHSFVLWLTGLSGSGKSTIADMLEIELHRRGVRSYVLDGDNLRLGLNKILGFDPSGRKESIRRTSESAKLFVDAGIVPIVAMISPFREDRQSAKSIFQEKEFVEVYIKCPLYECERRDPKGLYHKARTGEIPSFTGISSPYEEPVSPEITIETEQVMPQEAVKRIIQYLFANDFFFK